MFLQDQSNGAAESGHSVFVGGDDGGHATTGEDLVLDFGFDHWAEAMPGTGEVANHDDPLGSKTGDDHAHTTSKVVSHGFQGLGG